MSTAEKSKTLDGEQRMSFSGISYDFYKRFCNEIGERPIHLSFIDGSLEIMITKSPHEYYKKLLAKLVEAIIFERNLPVRSGGNMTFQRDDLEKGFEPDDCWWIAHEELVRGIEDFDFYNDPPPDLAIEIEISRSLVNRIGIFAAIGVPEIWRFDGKVLRFCKLQSDGTYADQANSMAFPFLQPSDVSPLLAIDDKRDETTRLRSFVTWLRAQGHSDAI